jgi:hypothetical protein
MLDNHFAWWNSLIPFLVLCSAYYFNRFESRNPAYYEEIFGPVAFYRVIDEEAAITLTNDSSFGLGAPYLRKI